MTIVVFSFQSMKVYDEIQLLVPSSKAGHCNYFLKNFHVLLYIQSGNFAMLNMPKFRFDSYSENYKSC